MLGIQPKSDQNQSLCSHAFLLFTMLFVEDRFLATKGVLLVSCEGTRAQKMIWFTLHRVDYPGWVWNMVFSV